VESQLEQFEARDEDDDVYDEDESEGEYDDKDENPGRFCVRAVVGGVWGGFTDAVEEGTLVGIA
jgi:hypothetical protein